MIRQSKNPEAGFNFTNATGFELFESLAITSTTTTYPAYNLKLSGSTVAPLEGRFILSWYFEMTNSNANTSNWYKVSWKKTGDVTYNILSEALVRIAQGNNYFPMSGFRQFDIIGEDTIDFRFEHARVSGTNRVRNLNIYIFRAAIL